MLKFTVEKRAFKVKVTVNYTDEDGNPHKGSFHALFRQMPMDQARRIAESGDVTIFEEALIKLYPDLELYMPDGELIEDEEARKTAALNDSKVASAISKAYWAEVIEKKD